MQFTPLPRHAAIPRAGIDPIHDDRAALALISAVVDRPLNEQMIVVLLDRRRLGHLITIVDHIDGRDDTVVDVAAGMSRLPHVGSRLCQLVIASVRPGRAIEAGDVDRWLEASAAAHACGMSLVEWYVLSERGVVCPRDLIGEAPRW